MHSVHWTHRTAVRGLSSWRRGESKGIEIGFVFSFLVIVAGPSDGAVYVCAPLIGEPACLV